MALRRLRVVGTMRVLPAIVAASVVFPPWGVLSVLLLGLVWVVSGVEWRCQGWLITEQYVVVQRGVLLRDTRVLDREKVQALHLIQGPIMRVHGIAKLHILAADASLSLPDLEVGEAQRILEELSSGTREE